jgi:DNA (cytosine-5)-methyltransferase 1
VVRELRPRYVLVENVDGLLRRGLGLVLGDLAALGYDAEWDCIPAAAVGAPHLRDRVFVVAYTDGERPLYGEAGRLAAEAGVTPLGDAGAGGVDGSLRRPPRFLSAHSDPDRGRFTAVSKLNRQLGTPRLVGSGRDADGLRGWLAEPDVDRVVDGVSSELDRRRVAGLGNAVVPQVVEWIGRRIVEAEEAA